MTLYERLMAAAREAFDAGLYEAAYHAVMAALHAAESGGDEPGVATAGETAVEFERRLDAANPGHRMASLYAQAHGGTPLFLMARTHADAVLARLRGVRAVAHAQAHR